jgi:hypothetical protein
MSQLSRMPVTLLGLVCGLLAGCGGNDGGSEVAPVMLTMTGPNAVSHWNEIANATVNAAPLATGTLEEQRPSYSVDMATVNLAIYDALMAITPTHRPYAAKPAQSTTGASEEAAVAGAAFGVLRALYPNRESLYLAAFDRFREGLPPGAAKERGLAVGAEVAAAIVALRANDGRSVALADYVPGTEPGRFRGTNPVGRNNPFIKPFAMTSASQFRAPGPPALTSATYAADVNETRAQGSATSTTRTAEQTELARFATENPGLYWTRNITRFAMTPGSLGRQARMMAAIWVAQADASIACFESKYHYQAWRPLSAITLADTDGNADTVADAAWLPVVPTPNHPEYPAAHSCITSATMEALRGVLGTSQVTFDVNSTVSATTRRYTATGTLTDDMGTARIAGGMHFRTSTVHGAALGKSVGEWILANHFKPL